VRLEAREDAITAAEDADSDATEERLEARDDTLEVSVTYGEKADVGTVTTGIERVETGGGYAMTPPDSAVANE